MLICFVFDIIFGVLPHKLTSYTLRFTSVFAFLLLNNYFFNSFNNFIIGIVSLNYYDNEMYSFSIVLSDNIDWILD